MAANLSSTSLVNMTPLGGHRFPKGYHFVMTSLPTERYSNDEYDAGGQDQYEDDDDLTRSM